MREWFNASSRGQLLLLMILAGPAGWGAAHSSSQWHFPYPRVASLLSTKCFSKKIILSLKTNGLRFFPPYLRGNIDLEPSQSSCCFTVFNPRANKEQEVQFQHPSPPRPWLELLTMRASVPGSTEIRGGNLPKGQMSEAQNRSWNPGLYKLPRYGALAWERLF